jgi:hypothetical protein
MTAIPAFITTLVILVFISISVFAFIGAVHQWRSER